MLPSQPVPEEQQSAEGFGYVVAFRPLGSSTWIQTVLASPDASRYTYRNESIAPLSQFEVKVGVYNSMGEGPFSLAVTVLSAEEGVCVVTLTTDITLIVFNKCSSNC